MAQFPRSLQSPIQLSLILLLYTAAQSSAANARELAPTRVMTFNIRLETTGDGKNNWPHRKRQAVDVIKTYDPDLLGLQEVLPSQRSDLEVALSQYSSVGGGRDADGLGEAVPIFYRRDRYEVLAAGMYWLSDTPEKPGSMTWGNNYPRACTWAHLFDRSTSQRIWVINTHWDHESQNARLKGSQLIAKRLEPLIQSGEPILLLGDFNVGPTNPARKTIAEQGLSEAFFLIHTKDDAVGTHHSFTGKPSSTKIDAVLVSDHWSVESAEIYLGHVNGLYPSDHFPIKATLQFQDNAVIRP